MEWLRFKSIYFLPNSSIGQLCKDLNETVGQGIYYDRFEIQNTKWLWFFSNMVTAINNHKTLCGCFGMYPSFVAEILNSARRIHFFVLYNEELNYENYIENCIGDKEFSVCYKSHTGHYFQLSYQSQTVFMSFEARLLTKLPSEINSLRVLQKMQLSCLV
jgi:hypothetical protein